MTTTAAEFQDRTIECSECHQTFVFTAGEQDFFKRRKFADPRRCQTCREGFSFWREDKENSLEHLGRLVRERNVVISILPLRGSEGFTVQYKNQNGNVVTLGHGSTVTMAITDAENDWRQWGEKEE